MQDIASKAGANCRDLRCKPAFTLIELLVVIAIISLLMSILMPSLKKARDLAKGAICLSHMRGTVQILMMYAHDNTETLPVFYDLDAKFQWSRHLMDLEYVEDQRQIMCPAAKDYEEIQGWDLSGSGRYSMAFGMIVSHYQRSDGGWYRETPLRLHRIAVADFSILADATRASNGSPTYFERDIYALCRGYEGYTMLRHNEAAHVANVDGSAAVKTAGELDRLAEVWQPKDEYSRRDLNYNIQYPGTMVSK